jgi:hypothetical protein
MLPNKGMPLLSSIAKPGFITFILSLREDFGIAGG